MTSLFGTMRRNSRSNHWTSEDTKEDHTNFLTSFTNGPVHERARTLSKKSTKGRKHDRDGIARIGTTKLQKEVDHNRNQILPHFCEKKIFLPMNDRMTRTNMCLEGLSKQQNEISLTNYRFIKVLGKGTFAKVKLAEHIATGFKVAIKIIDKTSLTESDLRKIQREIEIMKCLDHPNIIRLYEVIENDKYIHIVMEYAANGEIYDYIINKKRLSEEDTKSKFRQLISAIAYCHSKNIVHRDLKVENLLLDNDHNVKVCDFGFGNFFDRNKPLDTYCGSPPYAAPELFRGEKYIGPEVDVWSLGVILFTFLTGTLPFNGKTLPALKSDVLKGNIIVPNYVRVGSEVFLRKFLKLIPEQRISLQQAMTEPWITSSYGKESLIRKNSCLEHPINKAVVDEMIDMGYRKDSILESVDNALYDSLHATYRILCVHNGEISFFDSFKNHQKEVKIKKKLNSEHNFPPQNLPTNSPRFEFQQQQQTPYKYFNSDNNMPKVTIPNSQNDTRRQTTTKDLHKNQTSMEHQPEKFLRRNSIGAPPDLISNVKNTKLKEAMITRKASLRGNLTPDVVLKKNIIDDIKRPSRPQKSFKEISMNFFKRTKNIELTTKEEIGFFARLPSISLRSKDLTTTVNTTVDNKTNHRPPLNYSAVVSHRFSLDIRNNNSKGDFFRKSPSKQSLSHLQTSEHPVSKPHSPSFKQQFFELFRIKRH